jgi:hypothetical protein
LIFFFQIAFQKPAPCIAAPASPAFFFEKKEGEAKILGFPLAFREVFS